MRRRGRRSRSESRVAGRSSSSRLVSQVERERRDKIEKENQILLKLVYTREHKVLTFVEYRAVPGVFQNFDPPPPLHSASVSSPRVGAHQRRGYVHTRRAMRGVGGQYFGRRQPQDWSLTVKSRYGREYGLMCRGLGFLAVVWLGSSHTPKLWAKHRNSLWDFLFFFVTILTT
jgi:hypothetical protein